MRTYYECNSCKYKSTRKTNANRHIKIIHNGNARAFNFKTGIDSASASNKHHFQELDLETNTEELHISRAIEKIHKPFETLEKLLSQLPNDIRYPYLANTLKHSFLTKDPAKFIEDQIKEIRPAFYLTNLAVYLARDKSMSMSITQAQDYIKTSIASCYHLKSTIDITRISKPTQNFKDIDSLLSRAAITCLFNKEQARNIIDRVLTIDPTNKIAISIKDFIDTLPDSYKKE
ncbi:MAG: hypothetical protein AB7O87_13495 [Candidatus Nitrosocosmicus sp.]